MSEPINLFVIETTGTERLFWTCSSEHGCGWQPHQPKQAFSKSELCKQLASMIENGTLPISVTIRQLGIIEGLK